MPMPSIARTAAFTSHSLARTRLLAAAAFVALAAAFALAASPQSANAQTNQAVTPANTDSTSRTDSTNTTDVDAGAPASLKQQSNRPQLDEQQDDRTRPQQANTPRRETLPRYVPGEFEQYVQRIAAQQFSTGETQDIRRFGSDLVTGAQGAADSSAQVPADYAVSTGDELAVSIWGSVNADLRLVVDRAGNISIPRVGSVLVAGTHYADLNAAISKRVAQVFRNFEVNATLECLRSVRIYVTGFTALARVPTRSAACRPSSMR